MCDLLTAAAVITAGGSILSGVQQNSVAQANARVLRGQAVQERQLGALRDSQVRRAYRRQAGLQRSQIAATGATLDSATALDLGADLGVQGFLDSQSARLDSANRALAMDNGAKLAKAEGRSALLRGFASAAGTALTAAAPKWPGLEGGWSGAGMSAGSSSYAIPGGLY